MEQKKAQQGTFDFIEHAYVSTDNKEEGEEGGFDFEDSDKEIYKEINLNAQMHTGPTYRPHF